MIFWSSKAISTKTQRVVAQPFKNILVSKAKPNMYETNQRGKQILSFLTKKAPF